MEEAERRFVSNLDDFSAPCQIDVFWFRQPDVQYLIATHWGDRPDLETTINGPIPTHEAVDRLETILGESRWNRPVPSEDVRLIFLGDVLTFREVLEHCFVGIVNDLR